MKAEAEDDDELYIVDNNGEEQLFDCSGQDFENRLRVPLFEILKYPYLLLHERVSEYLGCINFTKSWSWDRRDRCLSILRV